MANINDPISVNAMLSGNLFERMRFAYLSDPNAFLNAFSSLGINIDNTNIYNEISTLNDFYQKGYDLSGVLKDNNGKPIVFSIYSTVDSIKPSKKISNIAVY